LSSSTSMSYLIRHYSKSTSDPLPQMKVRLIKIQIPCDNNLLFTLLLFVHSFMLLGMNQKTVQMVFILEGIILSFHLLDLVCTSPLRRKKKPASPKVRLRTDARIFVDWLSRVAPTFSCNSLLNFRSLVLCFPPIPWFWGFLLFRLLVLHQNSMSFSILSTPLDLIVLFFASAIFFGSLTQ
jgi:hypothetical protein